MPAATTAVAAPASAASCQVRARAAGPALVCKVCDISMPFFLADWLPDPGRLTRKAWSVSCPDVMSAKSRQPGKNRRDTVVSASRGCHGRHATRQRRRLLLLAPSGTPAPPGSAGRPSCCSRREPAWTGSPATPTAPRSTPRAPSAPARRTSSPGSASSAPPRQPTTIRALPRRRRRIFDPMRATARVYWRLLVAGFRRQSAYRLAALGGLVANMTFGLLKVAILFATVRAAGGTLHGYTTESMSTYVWLSQGMLGSVNLNGRTDLALRVKDGRVAVDFLRPVDLQAATIATESGMALFALLPRGLPSVLLGAVTVSMLLGIVISAATVYLIAVLGFWLIETRGLQILYMVASGFLSGLYVPI